MFFSRVQGHRFGDLTESRKMNVLKDSLLPLAETGVLLALIYSEGTVIPRPGGLLSARPPKLKL
jgi:hypothetical protein